MGFVKHSLPSAAIISTVFEAGVDGYGSYRIPALLHLPSGQLLAFCEARAILSDHAQNKLVMKTSLNNGLTWSDQILVADAGKNALNNPLVVTDSVSGDIILMYQEYPKTARDAVTDPSKWVSHAGQDFESNVHEGAVEEGYEGNICRSFVKRSVDKGQTWTDALEVTRQVKRPVDVTSYAGGPGIGIQIRHSQHKNRLIMPFTQGPWSNMKVYAVYSDDGGYTWQYGNVAPAAPNEHANEIQMAELEDGTLVLNARSFHGKKLRKTAFSNDGGITWSPLQDTPDLPEPECQGSIISVQANNTLKGLLYCGPQNQTKRSNAALKFSGDKAASWRTVASVYEGSFGYSSICQLNTASIGILFERDNYSAISFAQVDVQL